jgi:hypothetical protein
MSHLISFAENGHPQCACEHLDDDLIEDGYTCYYCYEMDAE